MGVASSIVHHFNLRDLHHHHGHEKHGTLDHSYCTLENFTSSPLHYMNRNLILSFSCDSVHYHFYPSSSVHFSSNECCRVLFLKINMFESWKTKPNQKLSICSLFRRRRMGNRQDSQQKSGENDSFPEELSLSRLSGRPTIWRYDLVRPVLSGEAGTIWWGRYYLVRPVLSGEAGRYYLVRTILSGEAGTDRWGRYHLMRLVQSGEADTIWGDRYYQVRPVPSRKVGTVWWDLYSLVRPVLSSEAGPILWGGLYYLVRPVPSREAGAVWWGRYYLVRPVLSGEACTVWWCRYYLVMPVLSGDAGTI